MPPHLDLFVFEINTYIVLKIEGTFDKVLIFDDFISDKKSIFYCSHDEMDKENIDTEYPVEESLSLFRHPALLPFTIKYAQKVCFLSVKLAVYILLMVNYIYCYMVLEEGQRCTPFRLLHLFGI